MGALLISITAAGKCNSVVKVMTIKVRALPRNVTEATLPCRHLVQESDWSSDVRALRRNNTLGLKSEWPQTQLLSPGTCRAPAVDGLEILHPPWEAGF